MAPSTAGHHERTPSVALDACRQFLCLAAGDLIGSDGRTVGES